MQYCKYNLKSASTKQKSLPSARYQPKNASKISSLTKNTSKTPIAPATQHSLPLSTSSTICHNTVPPTHTAKHRPPTQPKRPNKHKKDWKNFFPVFFVLSNLFSSPYNNVWRNYDLVQSWLEYTPPCLIHVAFCVALVTLIEPTPSTLQPDVFLNVTDDN